MTWAMSTSRLVPAGTVTAPSTTRIALVAPVPVVSSTTPPEFCAASPYDRPSPRATTPRSAWSATSAASSSTWTGTRTSDDDGMARPQPVSNLVSRSLRALIPCLPGGSAPRPQRIRLPGGRSAATGFARCARSSRVNPQSEDDEPHHADQLQLPVGQDDLLRRLTLALVDEERVPEQTEDERQDGQLVPRHARGRLVRLLERPEAVTDQHGS